MLKAVCEFNEILSVSHCRQYDIVIYVRPNHLFHLKKFSIKTYGAPILQLADQFQLPKYTR